MLDFIDELLLEINAERDQMPMIDAAKKNETFPDEVIKHWLNFAVYYERAAVSFIGGWLKSVEEVDALQHLSHQVEDECNHFRWLNKHLLNYGVNFEQFNAPREWRFLMEEYYPSLPTLLERLSAHNIAAETGALGFLEYGLSRFPEAIKTTVTKVIKDERYHLSFGIKLLRKYCVTKDQRALVRYSALESLRHMQSAREVFVMI